MFNVCNIMAGVEYFSSLTDSSISNNVLTIWDTSGNKEDTTLASMYYQGSITCILLMESRMDRMFS